MEIVVIDGDEFNWFVIMTRRQCLIGLHQAFEQRMAVGILSKMLIIRLGFWKSLIHFKITFQNGL